MGHRDKTWITCAVGESLSLTSLRKNNFCRLISTISTSLPIRGCGLWPDRYNRHMKRHAQNTETCKIIRHEKHEIISGGPSKISCLGVINFLDSSSVGARATLEATSQGLSVKVKPSKPFKPMDWTSRNNNEYHIYYVYIYMQSMIINTVLFETHQWQSISPWSSGCMSSPCVPDCSNRRATRLLETSWHVHLGHHWAGRFGLWEFLSKPQGPNGLLWVNKCCDFETFFFHMFSPIR